MADDDKGARGASDDTSGDSADDSKDQSGGAADGKKVSYETYKKTVASEKAAKARLKELESKLTDSENDKLTAEGKKDELIAKLKGDHEKLSKQHKDTLNSFVFSSLDAQVREEAVKLGCIDADAVGKLIDMSDIEVDPKTFKADKEKLSEVLDELKKSKPYLFNKAGPKLNSKLPGGKTPKQTDGKKLSDLSRDEIMQKLRSL